jgi:hypothetical protein
VTWQQLLAAIGCPVAAGLVAVALAVAVYRAVKPDRHQSVSNEINMVDPDSGTNPASSQPQGSPAAAHGPSGERS